MTTTELRDPDMIESEGARRPAFGQLSVDLDLVRFGVRPDLIYHLALRLLGCDPCHTLKREVAPKKLNKSISG